MSRLICLLAVLLAVPFFVQADSAEEVENIREKMVEAFPNFTPDSITKSPIEGLYEVLYGTAVVYVTSDARHIFEGSVYDLDNDKNDLTAAAQDRARKKFISEINNQESIEFGDGKPKHTVTVFTDIDCGYCRKLHAEMDEYASYGIQVNYLLFPRGGLTGASHNKAVSVWCSDDRAEALTRAKNGETLDTKSCDNPIGEHYALGQKIGVRGTPAIVTDEGQMLSGYLPPKQLAQRLDEMAK